MSILHLTARLLCVAIPLAGMACRREPPRAAGTDAVDVVTPVAAEPARRDTMKSTVHVSGMVVPSQGAEFLAIAPEATRVVEMPHAEGDRVAAGDLLVRLDVQSTATEVSRQRADLARAEARLENARASQARSRDLVERGIISRREMQDADNEVAQAQTDVARMEAAGTAIEASLARAVIRAPFAGVVAQRLHGPGDLAQPVPTDPLLRLVDPERLEVVAAVAAVDASRILPGAVARITSVPGETPRLTVAARPSAGENGAEPVVRLTFVDPVSLPVDARVEIDIDGEARVDVIVVSPDALAQQGSETFVFVAMGGTARRRLVTTGLRADDAVEVTSGITVGELVITRGQVGLPDGAAISVSRGAAP